MKWNETNGHLIIAKDARSYDDTQRIHTIWQKGLWLGSDDDWNAYEQIALKTTDREREKKRTIENANELQWATLEQISINANEKKMSVDQSAGEPASDNSKKRLVNIGSICVDSYKYGLANATTEQNITYNA